MLAGAICEYLSAAGPRAINGMPSFFSCRLLSEEDVKKMRPMIDELVEQRKAFLDPKGDDAESDMP